MHTMVIRAFITITLVVSLLQMEIVCIEESIDEVECRDQQATCEGDSTKQICHFQLQIEELHTFASYIVMGDGEEKNTRCSR